MAKVYIANTPLILEDESGKEYRVEAGEAVALSPEQYESVAAHVTPTMATDEELYAQQAESEEQTPSENAETAKPGEADDTPSEKPARGRGTKDK